MDMGKVVDMKHGTFAHFLQALGAGFLPSDCTLEDI